MGRKNRHRSSGRVIETVLASGYPLAIARQSATRRNAWFQSFIMTILQRDIHDLANTSDMTAVPRLLSVVAARAGVY